MKLKGLHFVDVAETQEAVSDELKKVQKEEFSAAFRKVRPRKSLYMPMEHILNKKDVCLPHVSSIFKKTNPKTLRPHSVLLCLLKYSVTFWKKFLNLTSAFRIRAKAHCLKFSSLP